MCVCVQQNYFLSLKLFYDLLRIDILYSFCLTKLIWILRGFCSLLAPYIFCSQWTNVISTANSLLTPVACRCICNLQHLKLLVWTMYNILSIDTIYNESYFNECYNVTSSNFNFSNLVNFLTINWNFHLTNCRVALLTFGVKFYCKKMS